MYPKPHWSEETLLALIESVNEHGPYKPDWDSLSQVEIPAWFRKERLGIFIHWGAYSVPAATNEWYPRNMYKRDMPAFAHHVKVFGDQKDVGYKELIGMFKGEHFNPEEWMTLFQQAGAGYVFPVAEHHDGFQMYSSDLSEWNAMEKGPCRDVLFELKKASEKHNLHFCTSSHRAEHWWFMSHGLEFKSDVCLPLRKGDLYWPAMPEPENLEDTESKPEPTREFLDDWLARTAEIIVKYRPALLYFDWWIQHQAFIPYLKRLAAFYYNCGHQWGMPVAICYKHNAMPPGCGIAEVERGNFDKPMPFAWQMDTAVARNSWCYTDSLIYKSSGEIISALVDTVSKNGNMLLNIGPKADGTIPDADRRILEDLAAWMKVNAEAIRGTEPWKVWAEGPTRTPDGEFSDQKALLYTSEDFRFTVNRCILYAVAMVCPHDGHFVVRTLAKKQMPVPGAAIRQVCVLGYEGTTFWRQDEEALHVSAPGLTSPWPVVLKITSESFKGERGCAGYTKA